MVSAKKEKKGTGAERRRAEASLGGSEQGKPFRKEKKKVSAATAAAGAPAPAAHSSTACAGEEKQTPEEVFG
jgi:hypothetical protein